MTKRERARVAEAIEALHEDDGGWDRGMRILCALIGRPFEEPTIRPATLGELVADPERPQRFRVR